MKALREVMPAGFPPIPATGGRSLGGLAGRPLDLRELRYFQSVGRTGNFGRAARELNISQPTVTSQVLKLEEGLGTQLLIRHGRGVTLTQAGACLMDRIDAIMNLLDAPLAQAEAPARTTGTMTLALPSEAAPLLVPHLLAACKTRWPGLTLAIREGSSASLEEWVLDRRADIALLQDPPALDELDIQPVVTERLGLVSGVRVSTGDPMGQAGIRELNGQTLILPHQRHWIRRLVDKAAFQRGVALNNVLQVDGVLLAKEMVRNGLGCTVLPYAAVRDDVARGALSFRLFARDPLVTVHALVSRSGQTAPFLSDIRRFLSDSLRGLAVDGVWSGAVALAADRGTADPSGVPENFMGVAAE